MEYNKYKTHIVEQYGVRIEGWTMAGADKDNLPNPGDLGLVKEGERLLKALKDDMCRWVTVPDREWEKMKESVQKSKRVRKSHTKRALRTVKSVSDIEDDDVEDDNKMVPPSNLTLPPTPPSTQANPRATGARESPVIG